MNIIETGFFSVPESPQAVSSVTSLFPTENMAANKKPKNAPGNKPTINPIQNIDNTASSIFLFSQRPRRGS
jgi:hypothetical protein